MGTLQAEQDTVATIFNQFNKLYITSIDNSIYHSGENCKTDEQTVWSILIMESKTHSLSPSVDLGLEASEASYIQSAASCGRRRSETSTLIKVETLESRD